ncbi:uncharacterized protein KY384_009042 [Bacidia gigantensis]|uniref:uncharacterized protein n=1 Tax=Bacidia gigantensis TaxID=2732470 RepID=UPI001D0502DE|nr:uncharacterized protein KY384_009042 [Bacidia gigantensis]KAG8525398.1 hypothetical protein KY384_009042 [Bacidia gigantensis]
MDETTQAQFMSITGSSAPSAGHYLQLAEGNVEAAIELFYANDGAPLEEHAQNQPPPVPPPSTRPNPRTQPPSQTQEAVIDIDSDEDYRPPLDDDEVQVTGSSRRRGLGSTRTESALHTPPVATPPLGIGGQAIDDDEAMARRLQEEFYGGGGATSSANPRAEMLDDDGYRAPIQRTTETLVDPGNFDPSNADEMRAAVMEQMMARRQARTQQDRPGIFNQATSIWNETSPEAHSQRDRLARATGGASEASAKANSLAEMYRPPFELMSRLPWDQARESGKEDKKWILVNIQDPSIFDCQLLNRDIWKNPGIAETVKENFIFMQYSKDDRRGEQYMQYYFQNKSSESAYPHIAIVDPRTGEQVKKWSGPPAPKAPDFLMQLHEFLDRYSLDVAAKNPVAKRKPEAKKETQVDRMTEEQQLEMAMQASMAGTAAPKEDDPDDLTRSVGNISDIKLQGGPVDGDALLSGAQVEPSTNGASQLPTISPFASITSTNPHLEPASSVPNTTRMQFRHPSGRVVRRFALSDPVRRLYEWLKAVPLEGQDGKDFELVFMQKNLIGSLDESIEQAGLKNGTVMVEIIEREA